jgi:Tol biopolymer transport system component/putative hemolysin
MRKITIEMLILVLILVGCTSTTTQSQPEPTQAGADLANPASQNCIDQGGTLTFEERGDLGQFGVCYFEDNLQCEEWALMRGDCPVGGVKVTGYASTAGRYCAITGGEYAVTGKSGADDEQGSCSFKDGSQCDAWDYYNGICSPGTTPSPTASTSVWQTYTNAEAGYSIQVPTTWSQETLPDQGGGAIHGMAYTGDEGAVEVYWGLGFGGACPTGTEQVQLAEGEVSACHATKSDGTEDWSQIDHVVSADNSISVHAYTSNAQPSSHDVVLQVLSTLTFTSPTTTGLSIQPLTVEVCNGMAQAMSHTLFDLIPTQSEEPLEDWGNNAKGTGCQATITGTGAQFESPDAVVNALGSMLADEGWTEDMHLQAGGPTGIGDGYRKGDQICLVSAIWKPDDSANCPADQPISACAVTPEQKLYTVTLNCGVEVPAGQTAITPAGTPAVGGGAGQIVFDSNRAGDYRDLYVMNSDGYDLSRLTRGDSNSFAGPWSPDGQRIVYTTFGLTNSYIAVINADGSNIQTLDAIDGSDEAFPAWSPDGQLIAFTSRRDGNNEIYLMNVDGSNPVRLTNQSSDDFAPSWSPDGTQIVFVSDRDQSAGFYDLYIMNSDGSGVTRLTNDTAIDYSPDWSPDGKKIVFRLDQNGQADIYGINVDGSGLTNLTNNPANDWAPSWSPDGSLITFQTNRDGNWEIYRMTADGSNVMNLTNDQGDDQLPYWRP